MADSQPFYSPRMRPPQCATIAEALAEKYAVSILCKSCGNRRVVDGFPLAALCRAHCWEPSFIALGNHVKCRCGRKYPNICATSDPVDSPPIGTKTEAEYQALVRRLRD